MTYRLLVYSKNCEVQPLADELQLQLTIKIIRVIHNTNKIETYNKSLKFSMTD